LADFAVAQWQPYRGLATTYLFAYLRQQRLAKELGKAGRKAAPEAAF
jgi:3-methyladenine DNA glycosylase/8-oxoguanine DNA glycosylase